MTIYASLADNSTHGTDDLGVFFIQNGPTSYTGTSNPPGVVPQVHYTTSGVLTNKADWVRLSKTFVADSAYSRIAIGAFSAPANMNVVPTPPGSLPGYVYVDSVSIVPAQGITIGTVPVMLCRGDVIQVPYTVINAGGYYQPGNTFTLQLSDAMGNFTAPVNIGSLISSSAGTITGTLPGVLPAGTGYRLRIVSSNTADTSDASLAISIGNVIPAKPVAAANTPLCTSSGDIMLTATTTTPGVTWSWTGPLGFNSNLQNPTVTNPGTLNAGNYIVEASIYGCKSEKDTVAMVINQMPPMIYAGANTPLCVGTLLELTSTGSSPGVTWGWTGPMGYTANVQSPSTMATSTAMSGDYIVSATENGCTVKDTVTVQVKATPVVNATANTPVCAGVPLTMQATSSTPGATYVWTGPLGFTSNSASTGIASPTVAMSGNYAVTASLNGCSGTFTLPVTVNPMPTPPIAGSNSPACDTLKLTASSTPGATYVWTGAAAFTSTQQNPIIPNATPGNNGTYTVVATLGSCSAAPVSIQATVNPKPYLGAYASPNDTVCEGTVVTFVTVPMNGIVNPVFQWFKNNVAVPGQDQLRYVGAYTTGDTFFCRTHAQDLCGNNITLFSNKIGMVVLPVINNLSATISSEPALPKPGEFINFMCTVVSGGYTPQFQWQRNGQDIFGAIHANWSANNLAPYDKISCKVVSADPCARPTETMSDTVIVNFPTSVADVNDDGGFTLYPNPNTGSFKIVSSARISNVEVLNAVGQKVFETAIGKKNEIDMSLPSLANGVYIITLDTDAGIVQKRFTLQR